jgi:Tol biopolymer transport system component
VNETIVKYEFLTRAPVSGELLTDKLRKDLLAPEDALRYAIDIGAALSLAHTRGVVHGSVSPHSILIVESGGAVLIKPNSLTAEASAPYRAPEQVRGQEPDWRCDIFAFGAVLYEMVNGAPAFTGQGEQLDRAILESAPPPLVARSPIHTAMEAVISGCLEKDTALRRQRIQNAVIELKLAGRSLPRIAEPRQRSADASLSDPALASASGAAAPHPPAAKRIDSFYSRMTFPFRDRTVRARLWALAGLILLACAVGVTAVVLLPARNPAPVYRFSIDAEDSKYPGMPEISPDGRYLAWAATGPTGKRMLWVRALNESHAKLAPDTEGAGAPFWSPDSQYVGFFANQFLEKTRLTNGIPGAPRNICPAEALAGGGAWNKDGTILFAPGLSGGLSRVAASGGNPRPVTTLSEARSERSHLWPQFLPDGKHFIFFVLTDIGETTGVYAGALDSAAAPSRLIGSETNAVYAAGSRTLTSRSGYLLFIRNGALMGQPFSPSRLETTGDVVTLANSVGPVASFSLAQISVSDNGALAYQSAGTPTRQLVWMDRAGEVVSALAEPANWGPPRISPDGKHVAVGKNDEATGLPVIWILDAEGHASQFSDVPGSSSVSPVWSPDGSRIAFANDRLRVYDIYVQPVTTQGSAELVYRGLTPKKPEDWSRDGKLLLFSDRKPGLSSGIYELNMSEKKAAPVIDTIHFEGYSALSPDGKWLAYQSDEQNGMQVYVQPFDNGAEGTKKLTMVSGNGGGLPRWRRGGSELYYLTKSGYMYAVTFHADAAGFSVDPPRELFHTRPLPNSWNLYDVSPDGQRFLMNIPMERPDGSPITVTTSWTKALE